VLAKSATSQNRHALPHRLCGFGAQYSVVIVTDRVWNDREWKAGSARYLSHDLGGLHKPIGNDRGGGNTGLLG
jgi:hypothetical protein